MTKIAFQNKQCPKGSKRPKASPIITYLIICAASPPPVYIWYRWAVRIPSPGSDLDPWWGWGGGGGVVGLFNNRCAQMGLSPHATGECGTHSTTMAHKTRPKQALPSGPCRMDRPPQDVRDSLHTPWSVHTSLNLTHQKPLFCNIPQWHCFTSCDRPEFCIPEGLASVLMSWMWLQNKPKSSFYMFSVVAIHRLSLNLHTGGWSLCCCQTRSLKRAMLTWRRSHHTLGCPMDWWAVMEHRLTSALSTNGREDRKYPALCVDTTKQLQTWLERAAPKQQLIRLIEVRAPPPPTQATTPVLPALFHKQLPHRTAAWDSEHTSVELFEVHFKQMEHKRKCMHSVLHIIRRLRPQLPARADNGRKFRRLHLGVLGNLRVTRSTGVGIIHRPHQNSFQVRPRSSRVWIAPRSEQTGSEAVWVRQQCFAVGIPASSQLKTGAASAQQKLRAALQKSGKLDQRGSRAKINTLWANMLSGCSSTVQF